MQRILVACLVLLASIGIARTATAQTAVSVDARIGDFHIAVSNYYRVPEREVVVLRERHIVDDELPVVFFIAREARVPVARVIALRERGRSWWDISVMLGLGPEVYYVPVAVAPGPPYGRAHGHYKKPRHEWRTIVLSDPDVVHLVHVRFLSEYYGIPPERVLEARGRHGSVVAVYSDLEHRHGKGGGQGRGAGRGGDKGKGRGKNR